MWYFMPQTNFSEAYLGKQAALLADALNVHEATGLTPSQLQARVAELEGAIARANKLTPPMRGEYFDKNTQAVKNAYVSGYEDALKAVRGELRNA